MITVRELGPDATGLAYLAMAELRPHMTTEADFVARVNTMQRPEGYRLAAAFAPDDAIPVSVAGFRALHTLAWGYVLYVDDLVTRATTRSAGYGAAVLDWVAAEAQRLGCDQLHLDSGVQRFAAHRFYFTQRMHISAYHFQRDLPKGDAGEDASG